MSGAASASVLELRGLAKSFGAVRAVAHGDLAVRAGEVVALLGANGAGKSTLMGMLGGVLRPDAGEIVLRGAPVAFAGPRDAARAGVAFVQQELSVFPTLTVAENVFADAYPTRHGRIDRAAMCVRTRELLATLGADLDPDRPLEGLSTGACQMVEIARAMRREPDVVVFDEPTSSLSAREKERFHDVVRLLRARGVAVIYITHFIGEIFGVCDRAVVMREGRTVLDRPLAGLHQSEIVEAMLGEIVATGRLGADAAPGEVVLSVESLSLPGRVEEASFELRAGEVVGVWGLLGSGRTELVRALLGLDGTPAGRIRLRDGAALCEVTPEALRRATAFVTEDRRGEGLLMPFSVARNIALPNLAALSRPAGLVRGQAVADLARGLITALQIKVSGPGQRVSTLSGGNQQKVVLSKWLASEPRVLVLDEPTRGLDLSAKAEILRHAVDLATRGAAVLLVSSEPEELLRVAHRTLIVRRRRVVGELGRGASVADLVAALSEEATLTTPRSATEAA